METALERLERTRVKAEWAAARNLAGMSYEEQQAAHTDADRSRLEYELAKLGLYSNLGGLGKGR